MASLVRPTGARAQTRRAVPVIAAASCARRLDSAQPFARDTKRKVASHALKSSSGLNGGSFTVVALLGALGSGVEKVDAPVPCRKVVGGNWALDAERGGAALAAERGGAEKRVLDADGGAVLDARGGAEE